MDNAITTDKLITFTNMFGYQVIYSRPVSCLLCKKCLLDNSGNCVYGGPFLNKNEDPTYAVRR